MGLYAYAYITFSFRLAATSMKLTMHRMCHSTLNVNAPANYTRDFCRSHRLREEKMAGMRLNEETMWKRERERVQECRKEKCASDTHDIHDAIQQSHIIAIGQPKCTTPNKK